MSKDNSEQKDGTQQFIKKMREAGVFTSKGVPVMEEVLPLFIYKFKNNDKKSISEWLAEMNSVFVGVFISSFITTDTYFYFYLFCIFLFLRILLYIKTGR